MMASAPLALPASAQCLIRCRPDPVSAPKLFIMAANSILFALIILSAAFGAADISALGPRSHMAVWDNLGHVGKGADIASLSKQLELAAALNPYDAEIIFDLGGLYEWKAQNHSAWSAAARENRAIAIKQFRAAAVLRPSWSSAWAHLAYSKALDQQLDPEAMNALEKAMVFGPWKPMIQQKVIWVGLVAWDQLPAHQRESIEKHVQRSLGDKRNGLRIINLAVDLGREDVIRPFLETEWANDSLETALSRRDRRAKI